MDTKQEHSDKASRRFSKFKVFKWASVISAALVLAAAIIVPAYLSSESGRKLVLSKINDRLDGTVEVKDLSVGWFKGVKLTDLTFSDTQGTTSVSVKEISAKPKLPSLLFGDVVLSSAVVDSPDVVINVEEPQPEGTGEADMLSEPRHEEVALPVAVLDMEVKRGNATINLSSDDRPVQTVQFKNIESKVDLSPSGKESTFDLEMAVAEGESESQISAQGNIKRPKKKWTLKGTTGDFKVRIDKLQLSSLTPLFALAGKDVRTSGKLDADASIKINDGRFERIVTKANLADFKRVADGKELILGEPIVIDADISSVDEVLNIERLSFASSFCEVKCQGKGSAVDYDATADLAGLQDFSGQFIDFGEYNLTGNVATRGRLTMDKARMTVTGQGLAERLVVNKGQTTTPMTTANVGFDLTTDTKKDRAEIRSARIVGDAGKIEVTDSTVPLDLKTGDMKGNLSANLDLEKFQPFLGLLMDIPGRMKLAGRIESQTSITCKNRRYHVVTKKTGIRNLVITSPDHEPFRQEAIKVVADVVCDREKKELAINDLLLEGAQGESLIKVTKGEVSQTTKNYKTKVKGDIRAEYDLATVSAMGFAFLPQGLSMQGKRSTNLKFESEYPAGTDQFMANLNATTTMGFDRADYMGLYFGKADMDIVVEDGLMSLRLPPTTVNEGKVSFTGNVNFKEKPATLRMARPAQLLENVTINDEMTRRMIQYINPLFAQQADVTGKANFYCDKLAVPLGPGANRNDVEVIGTVDMQKVTLQPKGLLGEFVRDPGLVEVKPTKFTVADGWVSYRDMEVHVDKYPLNFKGRIGLDERLEMTILLPLKLAARKVETATIGETDARVPVALKGTLSNPEIDWSRVLEEAGKQILEQELRKGIERIFR